MKRKDALNLIKVEYAKNGVATAIAVRTYAENRISLKAFNEAAKAGVKVFKDKG